jgi:hypothetical protein
MNYIIRTIAFIALLCVGFAPVVAIGCALGEALRTIRERPMQSVEATIVGVHDGGGFLQSSMTFLRDEHGHSDSVRGIWGKPGDIIPVQCRNGIIWLN